MRKSMKSKGASKKAANQLNKQRKKAPSKKYGQPTMKDDPSKPGRKIGYATTSKTKLPDYKPRKTKKSRASKRSTKGKMY